MFEELKRHSSHFLSFIRCVNTTVIASFRFTETLCLDEAKAWRALADVAVYNKLIYIIRRSNNITSPYGQSFVASVVKYNSSLCRTLCVNIA